MASVTVQVEEHEQRTVEELKVSHAEFMLIQQLRAVRKRSIALVTVGGDGIPKRVQFIESSCIELA